MRAPEFWFRPASAFGALLAPLGCAYGGIVAARARRAPSKPSAVPVLCVGNVVLGGAGKTPIALDLGARLAAHGHAVHFLTRGYGGRERGPLRVDPARDGADDVGDEALLLAAAAPTWVARDRPAGCAAAAAADARAVVMDDGFQNPSVAKAVSVLVIDGRRGFGNGRAFPAGPLREPVAGALARADAAVIVGDDRHGLDLGPVPVWRARFVPGPEADHLRGRRVVAFAGIGDPGKFFETLRAIGCDIADARPFPDHHPFAAAEIDAILASARGLDAVAVTTAKDAVRLPRAVRPAVKVLTIGVEWDDEAGMESFVLSRLFPPSQ